MRQATGRAIGQDDGAVTELIDGQALRSPRSSSEAEAIKRILQHELGRSLEGTAARVGWSIFVDPTVQLGQSVVVPDLGGWRKARLPRVPEAGRFTCVADWLCEVICPATAVLDRTRKLPLYASQGVCWVWVVDPHNQTIEVLWLEGDEWVVAGTFGGSGRARISPFDGIELDLSTLWRAGQAATEADTATATDGGTTLLGLEVPAHVP